MIDVAKIGFAKFGDHELPLEFTCSVEKIVSVPIVPLRLPIGTVSEIVPALG